MIIFQQSKQQIQALLFKRRFLRLSKKAQEILTTDLANHLLLTTGEKQTNKRYYGLNLTRKIVSVHFSNNP